jgi:hypothetical protein
MNHVGANSVMSTVSSAGVSWRGVRLASLSMMVAAMTVGGIAPTLASVAARSGSPTIALKLSRPTTTVGSAVSAKVTATLPAHHHVSKETLRWGDGTSRVKLKHLTSTPRHTYTAPGKFTVTAKIVDNKGKTSKATATEVVTVPSGSYTGDYLVSGSVGNFSFFVAGNHKAVQDVAANVSVTCTPGGQRVANEFVIDSLALASNGSFAKTVQRSGVYGGSPATYHFSLTGEVNGVNSAGQVQAAGSLISTMTYNNGTAYSCTSSKLPWQVTRDPQPTPQPTGRPSAGSLSGDYYVPGAVGGLTAYVSPDRSQLQDVYADVALSCTPSAQRPAVNFVIDSLPIGGGGSFQGTSTESGVFKGVAANFTFTIRGHFHGVNAQGVQRAAGSLSATMTYNNGTAYTCMSDTLPVTLLRDTQPTQTSGSPPSGSYAGSYHNTGTAGRVTFSISSDQSQIQNFSTNVGVDCNPGGSRPGLTFTVDSIPIQSDGSFDTTSTESGTYKSFPASFTYVVKGHVHGTNNSGDARIAGSLSATMTYSDGTSYTCESDQLPWDATGP